MGLQRVRDLGYYKRGLIFRDVRVKLIDFSRRVLMGVSSFPGFRVKLIDFSRRVLTLISSFPGFRVKLIEFS